MAKKIRTRKALNAYLANIKAKPGYFVGTAFEELAKCPNGVKGSHYEKMAAHILATDYVISERTNPGHDLRLDMHKTEIKGALSKKGSWSPNCIFNHIGLNKDWEEIWFLCCTPQNKIFVARHNRQTLKRLGILSHQQGGKKSENDDYMISAAKSALLFEEENALETFIVRVK